MIQHLPGLKPIASRLLSRRLCPHLPSPLLALCEKWARGLGRVCRCSNWDSDLRDTILGCSANRPLRMQTEGCNSQIMASSSQETKQNDGVKKGTFVHRPRQLFFYESAASFGSNLHLMLIFLQTTERIQASLLLGAVGGDTCNCKGRRRGRAEH